MLVLTRKLGQKIIIGESIEITIVSIDENRVQLGVDAPKKVPVYRLEIVEKIRDHNQASVGTKVHEVKTVAKKLKKFMGHLGVV